MEGSDRLAQGKPTVLKNPLCYWKQFKGFSEHTLSLLFLSLGTGLGMGLLPFAPGTIASIASACLWYWIQPFAAQLNGLIWLLIGLSAVFISGKAAKALGKSDPKEVVLDEIVAVLFLLTLASWRRLVSYQSLLVLLALFRFFDIKKPFFIAQLEAKCPDGWGIVADDLLAAIYAFFSHELGFWALQQSALILG